MTCRQAIGTRSAFRIDGKTLISFSGGRTSGYMLRQILLAHGGALPADCVVAFANTGKEHPATLDFVRDCGLYWGVPIVWLEYCRVEGGPSVCITSYATASRKGEPFKVLTDARGYLPNPVSRFCTVELKIRTMKRYVRGVLGWDYWENLIGLRADEPRRLARLRANNEADKERWETRAPLGDAGITKEDVAAFWRAQNFDLGLPNENGVTYLGNCDLCFLKSNATLLRIMQEAPERAEWWIKAEAEAEARASKPSGARFRNPTRYLSYEQMLERSKAIPRVAVNPDDASLDCACTD
jgi:3'-phosphoadenosine 5'-phosphosulfate sulfotransferase (PAPS reductase)/FAD synthetase